MRDFLGNELQIGDEVVFMRIRHRDLDRGVLVSGGKYKGTIEHKQDNLGRTKTIQAYNQMIKVKPLQEK